MKSILIADDSLAIREAISNSFKKVGFSVSETCNGEEALDTARKKHHDLVITDLHMPVMGGLTLIKNLRKLPSYNCTPILVLTVENLTKLKDDVKAAGVSGWIVKPFIPKRHVQAICKFIDRQYLAVNMKESNPF